MRNKYYLYAIYGMALLLLAACGPADTPTATSLPVDDASPTPSPTVPPDPILVRVDLGSPAAGSIDPARIGPLWVKEKDLVENLFTGLTRLDGDSGTIEPALAESWETSSNGLTWTFTLRDDIFWVSINMETGQVERMRPITAEDVVYTVRRVCRAEVDTSLVSPALVIEGCREVVEQPLADLTDDFVKRTVGVKAVDDTTVEFKLVAQTAYFPTLLAMPLLRPVPSDLVDAEGDRWTHSEVVWTSGPYTVQPNIPPEEGYTLITNPYWPLERTGNIEIVQISFLKDRAQSFEAWEAGDLALAALPDEQLPKVSFEDDPSYRLLVLPAAAFLVASYDTQPLDNVDMRRALALATDRQKILSEVLEPAGQPGLAALSIVPPGSAGATAYGDVGLGFDPEAARAALADAGHKDCIRLPRVTLLVDDSPLSAQVGEQLIQTWTDVFGCPEGVFELEQQPQRDVETIIVEPPSSRQPRRAGLILLNWQADSLDAYHWLADIFACREAFPDAFANQMRVCAEGELALSQAATTLDPDLRSSSYQRIEKLFFGAEGEMPVVPLYFYARAVAIQPWIEVYPLHAGPLRFDKWVLNTVMGDR
ncbi:MAG: hypothetical protein JXB30_06990 [Anaerolineae bacterium]|nr:hypothetical protein [Anaerolineae bacterium]